MLILHAVLYNTVECERLGLVEVTMVLKSLCLIAFQILNKKIERSMCSIRTDGNIFKGIPHRNKMLPAKIAIIRHLCFFKQMDEVHIQAPSNPQSSIKSEYLVEVSITNGDFAFDNAIGKLCLLFENQHLLYFFKMSPKG